MDSPLDKAGKSRLCVLLKRIFFFFKLLTGSWNETRGHLFLNDIRLLAMCSGESGSPDDAAH